MIDILYFSMILCLLCIGYFIYKIIESFSLEVKILEFKVKYWKHCHDIKEEALIMAESDIEKRGKLLYLAEKNIGELE